MGQTSGASKDGDVQVGFQPMQPHGLASDEGDVDKKIALMRRSTTTSIGSGSTSRAAELGVPVCDRSSSMESLLSPSHAVNKPSAMRRSMPVIAGNTASYLERAVELGIPLQDDDTEEIAHRLIKAFDRGRASRRSSSPKDFFPVCKLKSPLCRGSSFRGQLSPLNPRRKISTSASQVLSTLRTLSAKMGCDIGGTLAKLVLMGKKTDDPSFAFPLQFGKTGRMVPELETTLEFGLPGEESDAVYELKFLCGETQALEQAMQNYSPNPDLTTKKMSVTGGGAHKFKDIFLEKMHLDFVPMKEMQSVVEGLRFVLQNQHAFSDSIFEINENGERVTVTAENNVGKDDDFLIVNIGSGISVLKVTPKSFWRVGGSACGGATYVGLLKLLCDTSYQEGLLLAEKGCGRKIDTLVSDIYGKEGSRALGLAPDLTAANFGKLGTKLGLHFDPPTKEDMSFSCLQMVMQVASVLAAAFSTSLGISTIYFVGGFLSENTIVEKRISASMRSLKAKAYFTRHCDFLGALGCLSLSIDGEGEWEKSGSSGSASPSATESDDPSSASGLSGVLTPKEREKR